MYHIYTFYTVYILYICTLVFESAPLWGTVSSPFPSLQLLQAGSSTSTAVEIEILSIFSPLKTCELLRVKGTLHHDRLCSQKYIL